MRTLKTILAFVLLTAIPVAARPNVEPAHPNASAVAVTPQTPGTIASAPAPGSMLLIGVALIAFGSVLRRQLNKNLKAKRL